MRALTRGVVACLCLIYILVDVFSCQGDDRRNTPTLFTDLPYWNKNLFTFKLLSVFASVINHSSTINNLYSKGFYSLKTLHYHFNYILLQSKLLYLSVFMQLETTDAITSFGISLFTSI